MPILLFKNYLKFKILKKGLKLTKTPKKTPKKQLFYFSLLRSDSGGTFRFIFGIYKKFGGNNPSILTPSDSVDVAT
jgi:hypothetical protein